MPNALIASSISRRYRGLAAVNDVSLTLEPGAVTALLGSSGAGKSTLLRLLAGLEPLDAGEIRSGETLLSSQRKTVAPENRRIGLIFQDFALFPHMNALENARFGLAALPRAEGERQARDWLVQLGLESRLNAYPHELSGGEQQRVAIARALAPNPSAILMDEPFSGLDPSLRDDVRRAALAAIKAAGVPALLVTHDPQEAMISADRLAVMRAGRIVQWGSPEDVYLNPVDRETAIALGPVLDLAPGRPAFAPLLQHIGLEARDRAVAARTEALRLDPASPVAGQVLNTVRAGAMMVVRIQIGDDALDAHMPAREAPRPGDRIGLNLDPDLVFEFERKS